MPANRAIVVLEEGREAGIRDMPIPRIRDEWMIVKPKAWGLNPTDWKHVDHRYANTGARLGVEFAGVVEEVGSKVTNFKKGDRVAGFCHGGHRNDHETGAFGDYILAKTHVQLKIPDHMSYEQAATLPIGLFTNALGFYQKLKLPYPNLPTAERLPETSPILINGGSTSTGMWAIQFAKLSGLEVVATSSPSNFEYLKWLGADAVFDYNSPTCGSDINKYTQNKLKYAWDCSGGGEELCAAALSTIEPSKYGAINKPNKEPIRANPLIEGPLMVLNYHILNEPFPFLGNIRVPPPDEVEFAIHFREIIQELLDKNMFKPIHVDMNKGGAGLEGVMKGLDELRNGNVRCAKLVYTM